MSLTHHQQNQLHLIEAGLLRSDPQLAARLSVFGRLSAGEAMLAWENASSRHDRIRQAAALIAETISVVAAASVLFLRAVLTLVAAVASGGRARPPAQRRERAQLQPGAAGRTRRPGLTADEHHYRSCPPGGRTQSGAACRAPTRT